MIKHLMKDPKDLDPLSDEQADLTRRLDAGGEKTRMRLIMFAVNIVSQVDAIAIQSGLSMEEMQRAAYEAHILGESSRGDDATKMVASGLWSLVLYLQAGIELAREGVTKPQIIEHFARLKIPLPSEDP